jgi:biopolymer transport protein ExbB
MLEVFKKGGPIMWPLLVVSIVALTVIIERLYFILTVSRSKEVEERFFASLAREGEEGARKFLADSSDYIVNVLGAGLGLRGAELTTVLSAAAVNELRRFSRGLSILDTAITISPLLGLLGTVLGMIYAFGLLGTETLSAPTVITGGIAEALIATAFGLFIAICSLLPFNYLNARVEEAREQLEQATSRLELILNQSSHA